MKIKGLFGSIAASLAGAIGFGPGKAPKSSTQPTHRRDFTMPLTLPSRRTAPRNRRRGRTGEQLRLKSERRRASIGVRAWHTGPVQSVPFQHSCGSGRRRSKNAEARYGRHWREIPRNQLLEAA